MRGRARGGGHGRQDGFTLIEVLVAFFIAALTLTAAMRVLGEGAVWARRGPDAAAHVEEAASIIDTLVASPRLAPGDQVGVFTDGRRWRVRVTDVTDRLMKSAAGRLLRIEFFAEAGGGTPLFVTAAVAPPVR